MIQLLLCCLPHSYLPPTELAARQPDRPDYDDGGPGGGGNGPELEGGGGGVIGLGGGG